MLGRPDIGTRIDSVRLGTASNSMPPERTCDSISGSPPSWLLENTVTASRPDDCAPIAFGRLGQADRQRVGFGRVDAELEVEFGASLGGSAEKRGGPGGGCRAEQAPAGQFRCFHYCFSPERRYRA